MKGCMERKLKWSHLLVRGIIFAIYEVLQLAEVQCLVVYAAHKVCSS
jgi:hypothetical protein